MTGPSTALAVLGSIPSPSSNRVGPFHMYGLMIAIGVIAAVELGRKRWRDRGGNADDVYAIAFLAVPAGLIGARLYHVLTDWRSYQGRWPDALKVWQGGLGIPGGIALGVAVGVWVAHRRGWRVSVGLDALVPGLPLAQAIGRLGNWWNQELFGRPSTLPWAVQIDVAHRPLQYLSYSTFQPTFLYEMVWNLALCGFLLWIDRRRVLRPGNLLPLYVGIYFIGRLWIEALRVDTASTIGPFRINIWLSIIGIVGSVVVLAVRGLRRREGDSDEPYRPGFGPDRAEADDAATDEAPEPGGDGTATTSHDSTAQSIEKEHSE